MPNHIRNSITIDNNEKAKAIFEVIKKDEEGLGSIDFEKIIPMPKDIFRGNLGSEEREKYGSDNWYDWSIANWGTKWPGYDFGEYDGGNSIEFSTAWSPPFPIYEKLSEMFPDVTFNYRWADEDIGFNVGEVSYYNKEQISINEPTGGSKEAYELAADIRGFDLGENGLIYSVETGTYEYVEEEQEQPMEQQM